MVVIFLFVPSSWLWIFVVYSSQEILGLSRAFVQDRPQFDPSFDPSFGSLYAQQRNLEQ